MSSSDNTDARILHDALAQPVGTDLLSQLARMSILNSASMDGRYDDILDDYSLPSQAEMDLHLDGPTVVNHKTDAEDFGTFVVRTAKAVHEAARLVSGKIRTPSRLQVTGPGPGSVQVTFRAPEPTTPKHGLGLAESDEPIEALAMRRVAGIFAQAEEGNETLEASLHTLGPAGQEAFRLLARIVQDAKWSVAGDIRKKGWGHQAVRLSPSGATRLVIAATAVDHQIRDVKLTGTVVAWDWSDQVMRFRPDNGPRVRVAVPDARLQSQVAAFNAERGKRAEIQVRMITAPSGKKGSPARQSRALLAISEGETEPTL